MSVIVIDGPEKVGKTTLINELVKEFSSISIPAERVHWGPPVVDDRDHTPLLKINSADTKKVWIWDRSWASEFVYGKLLDRNHRGVEDPWLMEWLHGRAVQVSGLRIILAAIDLNEVTNLRDSSDLPVDPSAEQNLYIEYGKRFGWDVLYNQHTASQLKSVTSYILHKFAPSLNKEDQTPRYAGPLDANILVIGSPSKKKLVPGGWLPFTTYSGTQFGREFGRDAFKVLWSQSDTCNPEQLKKHPIVITCGKVAATWYKQNKQGGVLQTHINIPDPVYLYSYHKDKTWEQRKYVQQVIQSLKP